MEALWSHVSALTANYIVGSALRHPGFNPQGSLYAGSLNTKLFLSSLSVSRQIITKDPTYGLYIQLVPLHASVKSVKISKHSEGLKMTAALQYKYGVCLFLSFFFFI